MTTYREMEPHEMNYNKGNARRSHAANVIRPETVTAEWILEVFRGTACECGRHKGAKTAFCNTCYGRLSSTERRALCRTFGNGFEQAYEAAAAELAEYWQQIKRQFITTWPTP